MINQLTIMLLYAKPANYEATHTKITDRFTYLKDSPGDLVLDVFYEGRSNIC
jgi:hypothetical protein